MKKVSIVLTLALVLVLILTSCGSAKPLTSTTEQTAKSSQTPSATAAPAPKSGGVLKIVVENISNYFGYNGDMASSGAVEISVPCLENLVSLDAKGQFDPAGLITAYQVASDGKSVNFTLRKSVKFHDGTDFNAQSVKWCLEVGMKKKLQGTELFTSVEVADDYTVKVNVKHFDNRVMKAMGDAKVSSQAAFDKYGATDIHTHPVGTGPFKFVSFTPDIGVTWERFDGYWGPKPYLDGVKTFFIADDQAKAAALQSGDVDIVFSVTTETALALRSKGFFVAPGNRPSFWFLVPDSVNESSPLSKPLVRQAVEYAIDRNAIAKLGSGFWQPNNQPSEPTSPGYISNFEGRQYNVSKAKELLAQAGYPNGFNVQIIYDQAKGLQDVMVSIQQMLSMVGIKVDLQALTANVRTNFVMNGWQNGFIAQPIFCGPTEYLPGLNYCLNSPLLVSCARPYGWQESMNEAFNASPAELDAACRKLNTLLYEDATIVPLYITPQVIYAMPSYVHDTHIFETANAYSWTPGKAWLSK